MADLSKIPSYNKTFKRVGDRVDKYRRQQMLLSALSALPQLGFAFANYRRQGNWHDEEVARQDAMMKREQTRYEVQMQRHNRERTEDYERSTIPLSGEDAAKYGLPAGTTRVPIEALDDLMRAQRGGSGDLYGEETADRLLAAELRNSMDSIQRKYGPDIQYTDFSPEDQQEYGYLSGQASEIRRKMVKRLSGVPSTETGTPRPPNAAAPVGDADYSGAIDSAMGVTAPVPDHPMQSGFQRMLQPPAPVDLYDTNAARGAGLTRPPASMPASAPVDANEALLNAMFGNRSANPNPYWIGGR